jgi:hypothetical protein
MMDRARRERLTYFIFGTLAAVIVLLLLGATEIGPPNYGRYQISAWSGSLGGDRGGVGVFIVDTASGETKTVYSRVYGGSDPGVVVKDDLRKPFHSIK